MTQSIEIKNFTGGMNSVTDPYNLYSTEAQKLSNISIDDTGIKSKFYLLEERLSPSTKTPYNVVTNRNEIYPLNNSLVSMYEKVRSFQGDKYILIDGKPNKLLNGNVYPTIVNKDIISSITQEVLQSGEEYKQHKYNYFVAYRNAAGFESPLYPIKTLNGKDYVIGTVKVEDFTDVCNSQSLSITTPITEGYLKIFRMGDNISVPTLLFQIDKDKNISRNEGDVTVNGSTYTFSLNDEQASDVSRTWGTVSPKNLQYLTATKYGLAASNKNQVYLSLGKPDSWSELSSLNFGSNVTGIASVYRGFLVFTEELNLYYITGKNLSSLSVDILSTDVGCHSNYSIAEVGHHTLLWVYNNAIYAFSGRRASEFEPHTYKVDFLQKYGYERELTGVSLDFKYLLGIDKGFFEVDLSHRYKPFIEFNILGADGIDGTASILREFQLDGIRRVGIYGPDGSFWLLKEYYFGEDIEEGSWGRGGYGVIPNETPTVEILPGKYEDMNVEWTPGYPITISSKTQANLGHYPSYKLAGYTPTRGTAKSNYLSPSFTFGDVPQLVTYSSVEVFAKGEVEVTIYIDGKEQYRKTHQSDRRTTMRCILNNKIVRGVTCEVEFNFIGHIYSFRVNAEPHQQTSK